MLIKKFLLRKQEENPRYSLRALARDLKCSPSFLSEVLNSKKLSGKKKVPPSWVKPLSTILNLDDISIADLKTAILQSHLEGTGLEKLVDQNISRKVSKVNMAKPLNRKKVSLLSKWYYVAILDFLTLEGGPHGVNKIAHRLNLSTGAVREALQVLQKLELVEIDENQNLHKTDSHIRFPTAKSDPTVRGFHIQMIEKAKFEVMNKTKDSDFGRRLVTCSTIAADPKHTSRIKEKIQTFLAEIADEFSTGHAQDLYQMNIQLFPLTSSGKEAETNS